MTIEYKQVGRVLKQTGILYDLKMGCVGELASRRDSIGKTEKGQFVKGFSMLY